MEDLDDILKYCLPAAFSLKHEIAHATHSAPSTSAGVLGTNEKAEPRPMRSNPTMFVTKELRKDKNWLNYFRKYIIFLTF